PGHLSKGGLVITPRMLIAAPGVDPEAARASLVFHRRLAKSEITFPAIDAELDEQSGFQHRHEIIAKMEMMRPRSAYVKPRIEGARRQVGVDHLREKIGLKVDGHDDAPGEDAPDSEEKLKSDEDEVDFPRAVLGEPPNTKKKQEAERRWIAVQNR